MQGKITDIKQAKSILIGKAMAKEEKCIKTIRTDIICIIFLVIIVCFFGLKYPSVGGVGVASTVMTIIEIRKKKTELNTVQLYKDEEYLNTLSLQEIVSRIDYM